MEFCAPGMKKPPGTRLAASGALDSRTNRMGIVGKIGRNLAVMQRAFRNEGLLAGCECAFRQVGTVAFGMSPVGHPRINLLLYRITDLIYDRLNHVDTGGMVDLPEMEGKGRNYVGTPPRAWKLMMKHIPISPPKFTYIDFGCGKGRTLLLAAKAGFRRIIGVDIAQDLLDVAKRNFESRKGTNEVELMCRDVREFEFPDEPFVLFMYNPFYADVMQVVAERLKESILRNPRAFYVAYYSMACEQVWKDLEFRTLRRNDTTYPYYAIFNGVIH
jgi:hypothetical protein